jgi:hypothetical protein
MATTLALGLLPLLSGTALSQSAGETFKATASVASPDGTASTPLTIRIERYVTDAERAPIVAAVKANDAAATQRALEAVQDIGYIDAGSRRTPIKYAYERTTGTGRMVTVVTSKPVAHLGAGAPGAKPKGDHELALALLILDAAGGGAGEFSPAVTLKVDELGAIVTTDYSREVIRLTGISKVK